MLHEPYGWGELGGGRDCSRLIMDVFDSFGIVMPRNSKFQAMLGKSLGEVEGKTIDGPSYSTNGTEAHKAELVSSDGKVVIE
jgi:hypothetical protein